MPDTATKNETIVVERVINAAQETLFDYWTKSEKITEWLAKDAELDARPGGVANLVMGGEVKKGTRFSGENRFLIVEPYSLIEFTWGFTDEAVGVEPGSSIVRVDLIPQQDGTLVRVSHRDLPAGRDDSPYSERKGWGIMLERLEDAATKQ